MDVDLFAHIAQAAPGFVGVAAAKLMSGDAREVGFEDTLFRYFLYAGASWLAATGVGSIVALSSEAFTALSIVIAAFLGLSWRMFWMEKLVAAVNWLRAKSGQNRIFLSESILQEIVSDNKDHFVIAYRGNNVIASGWLTDAIMFEKSMVLTRDDDWEEYFRASGIGERTVVYADNDFYFKEYTMPEKIS